jgi:hypothetical protein
MLRVTVVVNEIRREDLLFDVVDLPVHNALASIRDVIVGTYGELRTFSLRKASGAECTSVSVFKDEDIISCVCTTPNVLVPAPEANMYLNLTSPEQPNYISPEAVNMAQGIVDCWAKARDCETKNLPYDHCGRYCCLNMEMQSGKTAVMVYIMYLINYQGWAEKLGIEKHSTYVLCHIVENQLIEQTKSRFKYVVDDVNKIMHSANSLITSDLFRARVSTNCVRIQDESHTSSNLIS